MKRNYQRLKNSLSVAPGRSILLGCAVFLIGISIAFGQEAVPTSGSAPIRLTSFTAKSVSSKKVLLSWSTTQEKGASHFIIEKSTDGKEFSDAGLLFSVGDSERPQQYSFTDELRVSDTGKIYYRLRMVDLDGKIQYSPVKVIRVKKEKQSVFLLA